MWKGTRKWHYNVSQICNEYIDSQKSRKKCKLHSYIVILKI